jgi:hypothetical protein
MSRVWTGESEADEGRELGQKAAELLPQGNGKDILGTVEIEQ